MPNERGLLSNPDVRAVIEYAKERKLSPQQTAYILATFGHESGGRYDAIREQYDGTPQEYFKDYSGGWTYYGRGYPQITHDYNYRWANEQLRKHGIQAPDLLKNPDWLLGDSQQQRRANALLMTEGMLSGQFGRPLGNYINDSKTDYHNARQSVNYYDRSTYAPVADSARRWEGVISEYYKQQRQQEEQQYRRTLEDSYRTRQSIQNSIPNVQIGAPSSNPFHRGGN